MDHAIIFCILVPCYFFMVSMATQLTDACSPQSITIVIPGDRAPRLIRVSGCAREIVNVAIVERKDATQSFGISAKSVDATSCICGNKSRRIDVIERYFARSLENFWDLKINWGDDSHSSPLPGLGRHSGQHFQRLFTGLLQLRSGHSTLEQFV